jgi:2',3'-cyclic-nucleotide 2'-phosphodiesterase (5'-nucleotidase family)
MLGHRGVRLGISFPEITEMQARAIFEAAVAVRRDGCACTRGHGPARGGREGAGASSAHSIVRIAEEVMNAAGERVDYLIGTMIELPRAALMAAEIAGRGLLLLRHQRPDADRVRHLPRRCRVFPAALHRGRRCFRPTRSRCSTAKGVGQLVQMATWEGRQRKPGLKVGICGEHGGEPHRSSSSTRRASTTSPARRTACPSHGWPRRTPRSDAYHIAAISMPNYTTAGTLSMPPRATTALSLLLAAATLAACASIEPRSAAPPLRAEQVASLDTVTIVLMGTTDVHGRIHPQDYYTGAVTNEGLARLKPLVDSVRAEHPGRTFLFDSGDLLQGNPLGYYYARIRPDEPNPIIRAMNLMGYDAAAIGNHEFNYGLKHLRRAVELAQFPFVSANIFRAGTDEHAYTPSTIIPVVTQHGDTLRVGVTGNTPPGVHVWDRDNVTGVLEFREIVTSVRNVVQQLRADGADIVVVLSHGGLQGTSYDTVTTGLPPENAAAALAHEAPGIDVIFMGHTHRELADTTINGVLLTQARNWAASLAVATLHVRRSGTRWHVDRKRGEIVRPRADRADRAFMDSLRWEHERTVSYVNARIGAATERMSAREARVRDTPVIDFINEVQRRTAGADLSSTAAFQLDAALPEATSASRMSQHSIRTTTH